MVQKRTQGCTISGRMVCLEMDEVSVESQCDLALILKMVPTASASFEHIVHGLLTEI